MITKLTKEQEARFPEFVGKWMKIGLDTTPIPDEKIKSNISEVLSKILKMESTPILIMDSPLAAWSTVVIYHLAESLLEEPKSSIPMPKKDTNTKNLLVAEIWKNAIRVVKKQIGSTTSYKKADKYHRKKIWDYIGRSPKEILTEAPFFYPYLSGRFWAGWFSFYCFFKEVLDVKLSTHFDTLIKTTCCELIYPLKNVCVVSKKFVEIHRNGNGLHYETGPALKYTDGFSVYALNGVRFDDDCWFSHSPGTWDPAKVIQITNVDQRRELIRRIGIGPLLDKLPHKVLDTEGDYSLLEVKLSEEVQKAKFLKMPSASIPGIWHVEGVTAECNTVQDCHNFRAEDPDWRPIQVT